MKINIKFGLIHICIRGCIKSSGTFSIAHESVGWWRCPWCNGYRRGKWIRRHEFKSWTRLIAFHIALIRFGKV